MGKAMHENGFRGRDSRIAVVLVRPSGPINTGMICRACANAGVADLRLVQPHFDRSDPQVLQYAIHAAPVWENARFYDALGAAVADRDAVFTTTARQRRGHRPPLTPGDIVPACQERGAQRIAIVFGNEADGLSRDEMGIGNEAIRIPAAGAYRSYNLSHAVAVTLYVATNAVDDAAVRSVSPPANAPDAAPQASPHGAPENVGPGQQGNPRATPCSPPSNAPHGEVAELFGDWLATLDAAGYFRRTDRDRYAPKLQSLLARLHLKQHDVHTLRGMFSHLLSALRRPAASHTSPIPPPQASPPTQVKK